MSRYDRDKIIGSGAFGNVWLVKSRLTRHTYVLKEINLCSLDESHGPKALNEAAVLKKCKHKHVIRYKDAWIEDNKVLLIVMEYAEGGDLYSAIKKQNGVPFTEYRIMTWFTQICLALQYIHFQNILHRDLKSQNIFLTKDNTIKVGDFGIARVLNNTQDLAETAIGTPYYFSPEICRREPYNSKSDIWALGCVLFELSALEFAFKAQDIIHLLSLILNGQRRELPRHCSSPIQNLIDDLFKVDPKERPSTDEILQNPSLQPYLSEYMVTQNSRRMNVSTLMGVKEVIPKVSFRNRMKNVAGNTSRRSSISGINSKGTKHENAKSYAVETCKIGYSNPRIDSHRFGNQCPVKSNRKNAQELDLTYLIQISKASIPSKQKETPSFTVSCDNTLYPETGSCESQLTKSENSILDGVDHGYHSQEASSTNSGPSNGKRSNYLRRSFSVDNFTDCMEVANGTENNHMSSDVESQCINMYFNNMNSTPDSSRDHNCQHAQCHQCILDTLWKNRIQPRPGKSVNTDEYSRLKKKLCSVYKETFHHVYQHLIYDWEKKEHGRNKFENIMNSLNFEQVQCLPLMMQLIQLDMLMNSTKE